MHFTTFGKTTPVASTFAFNTIEAEPQVPPSEIPRPSEEPDDEDVTQLQEVPLEVDPSSRPNLPPITTSTTIRDSYWRSLRSAWSSPTAEEELKAQKEEEDQEAKNWFKCGTPLSRSAARTPSPLPQYIIRIPSPPAYSTASMSLHDANYVIDPYTNQTPVRSLPTDIEAGKPRAPPYTPQTNEPRTIAQDLFWLGLFLPILLFIAPLLLLSPLNPIPSFFAPASTRACGSREDQEAVISNLRKAERKWAWRCIVALGVWCLVVLSAVLGWLIWRSVTADGTV